MLLPDLDRHDTLPKLLLYQARQHGDDIAMREKEFGLWRIYRWRQVLAEVQALALGLAARGIGRGDVVDIIGRNRPHWTFAELAAQAVGGLSLGVYEAALGKEVRYLLERGQVKLVLVEDEEQADKLLEIADQLPALAWIVYHDDRGMAKYQDRRLISRAALIADGGGDPAGFEQMVAAGKGEDVAIL